MSMSTKSLKPLIESAILTLEQILENKTRMARIDLYNAPGADHVYGDHKQLLWLCYGLCSNIQTNQINNLDLHQYDQRIPAMGG